MKGLLPLFENPSHYIGQEINSIHKSRDIPLKWCLAFPDKYPVAVSYFGHQILYWILNSREDIWAQRVYAPSKEVAKILRIKNEVLCTLEGDMPLTSMDIIGFSITHELCYTTILYMLNLGKIPILAKDRTDLCPIVIAGGEGVFNPTPLEPFFDAFVIGDGEEVVLEISDLYLKCRAKSLSREEILNELAILEGVYVPILGNTPVKRRIITYLKDLYVPKKQIVPFGRPVHDRYVVEISKGCTRGCRFCYAGMINRPVRERAVSEIGSILNEGLKATGHGEVGLLSLSVGDFSKLDELISVTFSKCISENISLSLPSLRAGSVPENFIKYLGKLKSRGLTLAPEAGTQRLRNVINKGISEQDIINHARWAFENGWQQIKLYFMIGLPTETKKDLEGIFELCLKVLETAPKLTKRVKVSASISPFVPKPHTPFQWERQNSLDEIKEKIRFLNKMFKKNKWLNLSWPTLEMSVVEGIFSRGDNILANVILEAYLSGDVFTSWMEHFDYNLWARVLKKHGIDVSKYLGPRVIDEELPWDFIDTGVSKKFLKKEFIKAKEAEVTSDCRWGECAGCGVCDFKELYPILNSKQKSTDNLAISLNKKLGEDQERYSYLFWFEKKDFAAYLSQLELQKVIERIMRRANIPLAYSQGYNPRPKISFGRALPVGVISLCEPFGIQVLKKLDEDIVDELNRNSIPGIRFTSYEHIEGRVKVPCSTKELFELIFINNKECYLSGFNEDSIKGVIFNKKNKEIPLDLIVEKWENKNDSIYFLFDWRAFYLNPLIIIRSIFTNIDPLDFRLIKLKQFF